MMLIASLAIGVVLEFALEVCTSLDRYGANLTQAIVAAGHSAVMPKGVADALLWCCLTFVALMAYRSYRAITDKIRTTQP